MVDTNNTIIEMKNITKSFPSVLALDSVHLDVKAGEVHIILGENGAGKSTLMKILSGVYLDYEGDIILDGEIIRFQSVKDATDQGVRIIYQELNLVDNLSVAENIFLNEEPLKYGIIDWKGMNHQASDILQELNLSINPKEKVSNLTIGEQQMIEVAHAISKECKILIMDEPTSALTESEQKELFKVIKKLKTYGVGIVYISHRLEELLEIGDRVTVFRDGKYIATKDIIREQDSVNIDISQLITMMVGRSLDQQYPRVVHEIGEEILRVENICTQDVLRGCNLSVRKGEILGLSGIMGAGRTELARVIFGADKKTAGDIYLYGKKVDIKHPYNAIEKGIGYLPEDRKRFGLIQKMGVHMNTSLVSLEKIIRYFCLLLKREKEETQVLIDKLQIKTPRNDQLVSKLSGGNQQKVVIAKWFFKDCEIFIFDEPTRGIDMGAKVEIYNIINSLVLRGKTVIFISSELPEILGLCDRVAVMRDGCVVKDIPISEASQDIILKYAIGSN